ncbi:hypothetical protein VaNZ11_013868, partial [Volvox africanus]
MAHTAQYHTYIRCEGNTLLRKLPEEARLSLRYYETVGSLRPFRPLPPLASSRNVITGKQYYYVAVTDWSLYLLSKDNKVEGSVLLEIPWLGIHELDKTEADSNDFMKQDSNKPESIIRSVAISIYPRADMKAITPAILRKAGLSPGQRRRSSASRKPSPARPKQQSEAVAATGSPGRGSGGVETGRASGGGDGGLSDGYGIKRNGAGGTESSGCCGWGSKAAAAAAVVPPSPSPMQAASQHLQEQPPQSFEAQQTTPKAGEPRPMQLQPSDAINQLNSVVPDAQIHNPQWQLNPDQATVPLRVHFVARRMPAGIYPNPQPRQCPDHRLVQYAVKSSPDLNYWDNASNPPHLTVEAGQPSTFCPQLHQMWGQWHQQSGVPTHSTEAVHSYVSAPRAVTYTDPYTGELYDEDWVNAEGSAPYVASAPYCWTGGPSGAKPAQGHRPGQQYMTYTLFRMVPGVPLCEAIERPSSDPAALQLSYTTTASTAARVGTALSPQLPSDRRESLFGTLRRRGEDGATTQASSAIAFTRTLPIMHSRPHDQRGGGSLSSSLRGPRKDAELYQAVEAGMRQHEESMRQQPRPQLVVQAVQPLGQMGMGSADDNGAGRGVGYAPSARPPSTSPSAGPVAQNRLSISLRPYLTGAAAGAGTAAASLRRSSLTFTPPSRTAQPQEDLLEAATTQRPHVQHQVPLQPAPVAGPTAAVATAQQTPSKGSAAAATATPWRREISKGPYRAIASAVDDDGDGLFPTVTRKGRRSRNLPPEYGSFQLPFYPSCQPAMVSALSHSGAASGVGGGNGGVSLPIAVEEPLVQLGEQVLRRQLRARPRTLWEVHERQEKARWMSEKRQNGASGASSGGGVVDGKDGVDDGGPLHDDENETAEEEYEDFWIADPDDDELSPEDHALSEYRLILVTIERKSNLFFHIQRAWIGAHMRLALTEAAVRGMPLWYAPAFVPRRLVVDMPALVYGSSDNGAHHETVRLENSELPEVRGSPDAAHQALQYFSEAGVLSRVLGSAAQAAGAAGALELFPGDSPVLYGMQPSGSLFDLNSALSPAPTLEDLSARISNLSPIPSASPSRKSLMQLGSLLAAAGRVSGSRPSPAGGPTAGQAHLNRHTSGLSVGGGGSGGGGTSASGGGGTTSGGGINSNELALSVSVSSAFLSLYDAQRSRRQDRLANALGSQGSPSQTPPQPADPHQRAGLVAPPRIRTAYLVDDGNEMGAVWNVSGRSNATSQQVQQRDGSGGGGGGLPIGGIESRRTSRRLISWHPTVTVEGPDERSPSQPPLSRDAWQPQPQSRQQTQPQLTAQPAQRQSVSSNLQAAVSIAAAANLAAERYGADVDAREARSFYGEVEEAMRWGCSLFDEGDAKLIQEIILERAFSQTPGARKLSKCFFNSRVVFSFILSRLYAWGAICAMFSSSTPIRYRSPKTDNAVQDSALAPRSGTHLGVRQSRVAALPKEVRRSQDGGGGDCGGNDSRTRTRMAPVAASTEHKPHGGDCVSRTMERVVAGPASSIVAGVAADISGRQTPADFYRVSYDLTGTISSSFSRLVDSKPSPARASSPGRQQIRQQQQYRDQKGPSYEMHALAEKAATDDADVVEPASDVPRAEGWASRGEIGGGGGGERGARVWWEGGVLVDRSLFTGPLAEAVEDGGPAAAATGPWVRLQRSPDPRGISGSGGGSGGGSGNRLPRSPNMERGDGGGTIGGGGTGEQYASFTFAVPARPSSVPSSGSYAASDMPSGEVPPLVPSPEPAASGETPFKPRPKASALDQAVELEEERAFFQRLHNNRTWAMFSRGAQRHRHLLRRLGLNPTEPTSIRATVETLAEIVQLQQQRAGQGPVGQRCPAPGTQAPPTLSPDPLSLSPLDEAPFLFVLQHQQLHGNGYGGADGGGMAASEVLDVLTGRMARAEAQLRSNLFGDILDNGDGSGGGGRRSSMMSGMRAAYLRSIMQAKTEPTEELLGGPAVELWERLVGRLAARLAHKRVKRLLFWVQQELAFSEGCEDRMNWLSDVLVESDPDEPPELDWSFARCSRTLVALVTQLADPNPPERVEGRYPPEVPPIKPQNATDMMYWIRYEIKSYSLDWSVGILYEMAGLSEEAQAVGRYEQEDIVLQVMRQLPTELLHQLVRRMFLRLACFVMGYAELYGVARQQSLAALVVAFRYGSVLLVLVRSIQSCAEVLADEFFLELYYLFRTQEVQDQLREVRGGNDALLAESTQHLFEGVLQCIGETAMLHGPGGAAGAQSVGHITNRAAFTKMPGRLT